MGFDPIHDRDVIDFELSGYLTKACTIGIHFDGLSPHLIAIHVPRLRRITTVARLAPPTLATHSSLTRFDLIFCVVTVWTLAHVSNLYHIHHFHHSLLFILA